MSTQADQEALAELLAAATAVDDEIKAAATAELTPDAMVDLAAQQAVEELREELDELREQIAVLSGSSVPGDDPVADADASDDEPEGKGMDFEEFDEGSEGVPPAAVEVEIKADYGPCPKCESTEVDEFADGTVHCVECGALRKPMAAKGFDFDETDELDGVLVPVEQPATEVLSEVEVLMARRAALDA